MTESSVPLNFKGTETDMSSSKISNWIRARLGRTPIWFNRAVDLVVDSWLRPAIDHTIRYIFLLRPSLVTGPDLTLMPGSRIRLLIGPMNYAGQAHEWANAIASRAADVAAVNLGVRFASPFQFETTHSVALRTYRYGIRWAEREADRVAREYTHILVEAEEVIFRRLLRGGAAREREFFAANGLSVAYVCHGSDVRSPANHVANEPLSPFLDDEVYVQRAQRRTDRNRKMLENSGAVVFVSTPDLVDEVEGATWLPVVVDVDKWSIGEALEGGELDSDARPIVLHTPSKSQIKGSHLIREPMRRLVESGAVRYREVSGVASSRILEEMQRADIVLDQFRIGSYGVAACEAMAAGRVVVGHVTRRVRDLVADRTGLDLPIVEATPDTLEFELARLVNDRQRMREIGKAGAAFVRAVHDGSFSATILNRHWIRGSSELGV